ncbi:hypothetical protein GQ43DRAFT_132571 [Delitschia confertaspora ATCC 74209]|uniref:Uncharacterized protein n=1 Tax=Delitschia confertaspora ATCC 74209 TaxID=1513339 RepID=A0A9P4MTH2_9PLEO|nr:hypothetical protein GQ43DRAFT_132571 [Delitschia confertaspora ATCC 74209]
MKDDGKITADQEIKKKKKKFGSLLNPFKPLHAYRKQKVSGMGSQRKPDSLTASSGSDDSTVISFTSSSLSLQSSSTTPSSTALTSRSGQMASNAAIRQAHSMQNGTSFWMRAYYWVPNDREKFLAAANEIRKKGSIVLRVFWNTTNIRTLATF